MKIKITILVLVLAIMLSGCSIIKFGDQNLELKTLQELGLAYKEGTYTMEKVYVSGFITEYQTIIWLGIPVGKKLVEGQKVSVTSATEANLRTTEGKYVLGLKSDLTPYVDGTSIRNDGAIIFLRLTNPNKWTASDGRTFMNNTPITGTVNLELEISE